MEMEMRKVKKACEKIKEIIRQGIEMPESQNDLRKNQLRELALLNGTLREGEGPKSGATSHRTWHCPDEPNSGMAASAPPAPNRSYFTSSSSSSNNSGGSNWYPYLPYPQPMYYWGPPPPAPYPPQPPPTGMFWNAFNTLPPHPHLGSRQCE